MERDGLAQGLCERSGQRERDCVRVFLEGRGTPGGEDTVSVDRIWNELLVPAPEVAEYADTPEQILGDAAEPHRVGA